MTIKTDIQHKLKMLNYGGNTIDGFYEGEKYIVVRLGGGHILRLEIDGNHVGVIK